MDGRKRAKEEQWQDMISRLYPELHQQLPDGTFPLSRTFTFQVTEACNLKCVYCIAGDTLIRMADYSLKPIKDIQVGDEVLGFDEYPERWHHSKVHKATVEQVFQRTSDYLEVLFESGEMLKITENHKVLTRRNTYDNRFDYKAIGDMKPGNKVYHLPIIDSQLNIPEVVHDKDYKIGYLVAMIKGDGSLKHYVYGGHDMHKFRIAVKDIEIINRCKEYLTDLQIPYYTKPYLVSKKHGMWQGAIFANTKQTCELLTDMINANFMHNTSLSYYQGYAAGFYDAEGNISDQRIIRICNTNLDMIHECTKGLDLIGIPYVIETDEKGTKNHDRKYNIRIADNENAISTYRFIKAIDPAVERLRFKKFLECSPLRREKIVSIRHVSDPIPVYNIGTSTHTYIANGIAVHNCYQGHKTQKTMTFETAKKAVDMLLSATPENNSYINPVISPGIIIEFIGGEPFLQADLIYDIMTYFCREARRLCHPWAERHSFSICSNGVLYNTPQVQRILNKYRNELSFSITIDGNKEFHDSCRVFPDGSPSYDIAVAAAKDWMSRGNYLGSKITIAPGNVRYVYDALTHMLELGYINVHANCVYEKGWTAEHARTMYYELKRFTDFLMDNDKEDDVYVSLFDEFVGHPMTDDDNQNYCGGTGKMLCVDPSGHYSTCIRFLPSSLGDDAPPLYLGSVDTGLVTTDEEKKVVAELQAITRRSQSTDECYYCPIASGCGWCSGLCYQENGTANKRVTHICVMHQSRTLANVYFWNRYYRKHGDPERYKVDIPEEWALKIIPPEEWELLNNLAKGE